MWNREQAECIRRRICQGGLGGAGLHPSACQLMPSREFRNQVYLRPSASSRPRRLHVRPFRRVCFALHAVVLQITDAGVGQGRPQTPQYSCVENPKY